MPQIRAHFRSVAMLPPVQHIPRAFRASVNVSDAAIAASACSREYRGTNVCSRGGRTDEAGGPGLEPGPQGSKGLRAAITPPPNERTHRDEVVTLRDSG